MTNQNDLYIKAWVQGEAAQETDTHWRCKKGKGSFNWRMKFDVELPMKFPYLTVQMWDRDIVKVIWFGAVNRRVVVVVLALIGVGCCVPGVLRCQYNDMIAEGQIFLYPFVKQALRTKVSCVWAMVLHGWLTAHAHVVG